VIGNNELNHELPITIYEPPVNILLFKYIGSF